jgi:hypothetical protein
MLRKNIAFPSESTSFVPIGAYNIMFGQHKTFAENQEAGLIQISTNANEEALFEVLTVYPDFSWNAPLEIQVQSPSSMFHVCQYAPPLNQKICRTEVLHVKNAKDCCFLQHHHKKNVHHRTLQQNSPCLQVQLNFRTR